MTNAKEIREWEDDKPITMLTAYDAPTAAIVDNVGIDIILVGDSMGNAALGYDSTLPVTIEELASHTGAVARSVEEALIVADLPFLSYGADMDTSIKNAGRIIKEESAQAIKLESGFHTVDLTKQLVELGIPVMAHLGLTPQHVNQLGSYRQQGAEKTAAEEICNLAYEHEKAGAFSLVLEHVPANLAAKITENLDIPVIGIGAGPDTDGQVLVINDVIGLSERPPPFAKQFGNVKEELEQAIVAYHDSVIKGEFPAQEHFSNVECIDDII
jgi:3-methyl-2-oxobutanoate hydroxymethyltransferase